MIAATGAVLAGVSMLGPSAVAKTYKDPKQGKKKILAIGAHPDDNESCCAGALMKFADAGHEVVSVYMTRGERGIKGVGLEEAAEIRTKECLAACKLMGVRPVFLTQVDGAAELVPERYEEMINLIKTEKPDIVFTHWPIDAHRDHVICSALVLDAWKHCKESFDIYYYEPMTGNQAMTFRPTDYVDISDIIDRKKEVCYCHASQNPDRWYGQRRVVNQKFRGIEIGTENAEGFIRFIQSPTKTII